MNLFFKHNFKNIILGIVLFLLGSIFSFALYLRSQYVVPILMYHMIDDQRAKTSVLAVSVKSFGNQMDFLRRNKYNVISLESLINLIKDKRPIPSKTVVITFDDGYKNNFTQAFPIIKKYRIPITLFVIPNKVGKKVNEDIFASWQELTEMQNSGLVTIASHTLNDEYLPRFESQDELIKEIFESKRMLEKNLARPVTLFSYPVGGFNQRIKELVAQAGYKGAVATNPGKNYPNNDIYALKRLRVSHTSDNLFVFWVETSGFYTWFKEHRHK